MELLQILFDWLRCVNNWEMLWAGRRGFLYLTLPSKQSLEKVLQW
jgi:hypothetical protein